MIFIFDFLIIYLCLYLFYSWISFVIASGLYSIYKTIIADIDCILEHCEAIDHFHWQLTRSMFLAKSESNMSGRLRISIKQIVGSISTIEIIEQILTWPFEVITWYLDCFQAVYSYKKIHFYMHEHNIIRKN